MLIIFNDSTKFHNQRNPVFESIWQIFLNLTTFCYLKDVTFLLIYFFYFNLFSQFTLDVTLKGNKPDFSKAMGPDHARPFYSKFLDVLKSKYKPDKVQGYR